MLIKCTEPDCACTVAWIETGESGEKSISFAVTKHHGEKHVAKFSENELREILKEAV